jgi:hypothetical protein
LFDEKNQRSKISCQGPFKILIYIYNRKVFCPFIRGQDGCFNFKKAEGQKSRDTVSLNTNILNISKKTEKKILYDIVPTCDHFRLDTYKIQ